MLALALALQAEGHSAVLAAPSNFESFITAHGVAFEPVGGDIQVTLRHYLPGLGRDINQLYTLLRAWIPDEIRAQFAALTPLAADADIIVGGGLTFAGHALAERFAIPYVGVAFCPNLFPTDQHAPITLPWQGMPRWLNRAAWRLNNLALNYACTGTINDARRQLALPPVSNFAAHVYDGCAQFLLAVDPWLAPMAPRMRNCAATGFWFHETAMGLSPAVQAFLQAGKPPVYVGFGSMVPAQAQRITERVRDAVLGAGYRLLLSSGWGGLGHGEDLGDDVLIVGDTPHHALFPHTAAVVHHGGAGTTAAALRAGVPQVLVPHIMDQFYWGHRLRAAKLAPAAVPVAELTVARLADALAYALHEPSLRGPRGAFKKRQARNHGLQHAVASLRACAARRPGVASRDA